MGNSERDGAAEEKSGEGKKKRILWFLWIIQLVGGCESWQMGAVLWDAKPSGSEVCLSWWVQVFSGSGYRDTHPYLGHRLAETPCLGREGSFSIGIHTVINLKRGSQTVAFNNYSESLICIPKPQLQRFCFIWSGVEPKNLNFIKLPRKFSV